MAESRLPSERRKLAERNLQCTEVRLQKVLSRDLKDLDLKFVSSGDIVTTEAMAAQLETVVEKFIVMRKMPKDADKIGKVKEIIITYFQRSYTIAQILLDLSKTGASVCAFTVFSKLMTSTLRTLMS